MAYTSNKARKPNSLLNEVMVLPRKSCEHKELRETPMEERDITIKPDLKLHIDKRFATTYDKDEGFFVKTSRKKLYHEITGSHAQDQVRIGIEPPPTLKLVSSNPRLVNVRYEENKKSYQNIFGYSPSFA